MHACSNTNNCRTTADVAVAGNGVPVRSLWPSFEPLSKEEIRSRRHLRLELRDDEDEIAHYHPARTAAASPAALPPPSATTTAATGVATSSQMRRLGYCIYPFSSSSSSVSSSSSSSSSSVPFAVWVPPGWTHALSRPSWCYVVVRLLPTEALVKATAERLAAAEAEAARAATTQYQQQQQNKKKKSGENSHHDPAKTTTSQTSIAGNSSSSSRSNSSQKVRFLSHALAALRDPQASLVLTFHDAQAEGQTALGAGAAGSSCRSGDSCSLASCTSSPPSSSRYLEAYVAAAAADIQREATLYLRRHNRFVTAHFRHRNARIVDHITTNRGQEGPRAEMTTTKVTTPSTGCTTRASGEDDEKVDVEGAGTGANIKKEQEDDDDDEDDDDGPPPLLDDGGGSSLSVPRRSAAAAAAQPIAIGEATTTTSTPTPTPTPASSSPAKGGCGGLSSASGGAGGQVNIGQSVPTPGGLGLFERITRYGAPTIAAPPNRLSAVPTGPVRAPAPATLTTTATTGDQNSRNTQVGSKNNKNTHKKNTQQEGAATKTKSGTKGGGGGQSSASSAPSATIPPMAPPLPPQGGTTAGGGQNSQSSEGGIGWYESTVLFGRVSSSSGAATRTNKDFTSPPSTLETTTAAPCSSVSNSADVVDLVAFVEVRTSAAFHDVLALTSAAASDDASIASAASASAASSSDTTAAYTSFCYPQAAPLTFFGAALHVAQCMGYVRSDDEEDEVSKTKKKKILLEDEILNGKEKVMDRLPLPLLLPSSSARSLPPPHSDPCPPPLRPPPQAAATEYSASALLLQRPHSIVTGPFPPLHYHPSSHCHHNSRTRWRWRPSSACFSVVVPAEWSIPRAAYQARRLGASGRMPLPRMSSSGAGGGATTSATAATVGGVAGITSTEGPVSQASAPAGSGGDGRLSWSPLLSILTHGEPHYRCMLEVFVVVEMVATKTTTHTAHNAVLTAACRMLEALLQLTCQVDAAGRVATNAPVLANTYQHVATFPTLGVPKNSDGGVEMEEEAWGVDDSSSTVDAVFLFESAASSLSSASPQQQHLLSPRRPPRRVFVRRLCPPNTPTPAASNAATATTITTTTTPQQLPSQWLVAVEVPLVEDNRLEDHRNDAQEAEKGDDKQQHRRDEEKSSSSLSSLSWWAPPADVAAVLASYASVTMPSTQTSPPPHSSKAVPTVAVQPTMAAVAKNKKRKEHDDGEEKEKESEEEEEEDEAVEELQRWLRIPSNVIPTRYINNDNSGGTDTSSADFGDGVGGGGLASRFTVPLSRTSQPRPWLWTMRIEPSCVGLWSRLLEPEVVTIVQKGIEEEGEGSHEQAQTTHAFSFGGDDGDGVHRSGNSGGNFLPFLLSSSSSSSSSSSALSFSAERWYRQHWHTDAPDDGLVYVTVEADDLRTAPDDAFETSTTKKTGGDTTMATGAALVCSASPSNGSSNRRSTSGNNNSSADMTDMLRSMLERVAGDVRRVALDELGGGAEEDGSTPEEEERGGSGKEGSTPLHALSNGSPPRSHSHPHPHTTNRPTARVTEAAVRTLPAASLLRLVGVQEVGYLIRTQLVATTTKAKAAASAATITKLALPSSPVTRAAAAGGGAADIARATAAHSATESVVFVPLAAATTAATRGPSSSFASPSAMSPSSESPLLLATARMHFSGVNPVHTMSAHHQQHHHHQHPSPPTETPPPPRNGPTGGTSSSSSLFAVVATFTNHGTGDRDLLLLQGGGGLGGGVLGGGGEGASVPRDERGDAHACKTVCLFNNADGGSYRGGGSGVIFRAVVAAVCADFSSFKARRQWYFDTMLTSVRRWQGNGNVTTEEY